jgi:hypothetical protein
VATPFRCPQCKAVTQFEFPASGASPVTVTCSGCGRRYNVSVPRQDHAAGQDGDQHATAYAQKHGIDLETARSVLEGHMTLEDAKALRQEAGVKSPPPSAPARGGPAPMPPADPKTPATTSAASAPMTPAPQERVPESAPRNLSRAGPGRRVHGELAYDPGFAKAVATGSLTVRQAIERGDRKALAASLALKHKLPAHLAVQVADNRITVLQAIELKAAEKAKQIALSRTFVPRGPMNYIIYGLGAVLLCGLGVQMYRAWGDYQELRGAAELVARANATARKRPERVAPTPPPRALTDDKTDGAGQPTQIIGPDPRTVLISFCQTGGKSGHWIPIEIAPAVPPHPSLKLGIFRSLDQPGAPPRAIRIREDAKTGRWVAGDGRSPIPTDTPPVQPPGAQIIPVQPPAPGR